MKKRKNVNDFNNKQIKHAEKVEKNVEKVEKNVEKVEKKSKLDFLNFNLLSLDNMIDVTAFNGVDDWKNLGILNKDMREAMKSKETIQRMDWIITIPKMRKGMIYTIPDEMKFATKADLTFPNAQTFTLTIKEILKKMTNLTHLIVRGVGEYTQKFINIIKDMKHLKKFEIFRLSSPPGFFSTPCISLKHLIINCNVLTRVEQDNRKGFYMPSTIELIASAGESQSHFGSMENPLTGFDTLKIVIDPRGQRPIFGRIMFGKITNAKRIEVNYNLILCAFESVGTIMMSDCTFERPDMAVPAFNNVNHLIISENPENQMYTTRGLSFDNWVGFINFRFEDKFGFKELSIYRNIHNEKTISIIENAGIKIHYI